jgi:predicted RNA-binding Zn ribbon-like protein
LNFVNTHDHQGRLPDRFADVAGLQEWLGCLLPPINDAVVTIADAAEAREIRDALVTVMLTHADASGVSEDELVGAEQALQRASQRFPLQANITRAHAGLMSVQPALAGVLGTVLVAVVELAQSNNWNRVKACRNCHHGFVDNSRNLSAAFCSTQCKSQAGMRAYRSRQRQTSDD